MAEYNSGRKPNPYSPSMGKIVRKVSKSTDVPGQRGLFDPKPNEVPQKENTGKEITVDDVAKKVEEIWEQHLKGAGKGQREGTLVEGALPDGAVLIPSGEITDKVQGSGTSQHQSHPTKQTRIPIFDSYAPPVRSYGAIERIAYKGRVEETRLTNNGTAIIRPQIRVSPERLIGNVMDDLTAYFKGKKLTFNEAAAPKKVGTHYVWECRVADTGGRTYAWVNVKYMGQRPDNDVTQQVALIEINRIVSGKRDHNESTGEVESCFRYLKK